jgi:hypothetical protein
MSKISDKSIDTIKNLLTFGVEIECGLDSKQTFFEYLKDNFGKKYKEFINNEEDEDNFHIIIAEILSQKVKTVTGHHNDFDNWHVGRDGSLSFKYESIEIRSRVLEGDEGIKEVREVLQILNEAGFKVNKTCGLHIHIGSKIIDKYMLKNLILLYSLLQKRMERNIFTKDRIANDYCKDLNSLLQEYFNDLNVSDRDNNIINNIKRLNELADDYNFVDVIKTQRYASLSYSNIVSANRHGAPIGTIEFRQLQGTIDFNLFLFWMNFIYNLVYYSQNKHFNKLMEEIINSDFGTPTEKIELIFDKIGNRSMARQINRKTIFKSEYENLINVVSQNKHNKDAAGRFFKKYAESFI